MQVEVIKEKITQAPDNSYEIGVFIGTYLPFVILTYLIFQLIFSFYVKKNYMSFIQKGSQL
jgi:hypothetical protein